MEAARRVIAHVDADAFYASVHLLENPSLIGKPVVVAWEGPRSIVTTASYEARKFGIGSAMPASKARRLCPHAVFIRPDFDLYRDYSRRAREIMEATCETIEPLSLDEAYLDVTQVMRPVRVVREMIAGILAETGLQFSVGIGPNKLCAKVLSDLNKPSAFNVASREQCCEIFAKAPPRKIPGIGPKTAETLESIGIHTIAALRDADVDRLVLKVGERRALELQSRARFEHDGVVERNRETKSQSEETTFDEDVRDADLLEGRMRRMAIELCERLAARNLRGRTIGIKVRLADFTTITRARTIDVYTSDGEVVAQIACDILAEYDAQQPVRLLGVRVASFYREGEADTSDDAPAGRWGQQLRLPDAQPHW